MSAQAVADRPVSFSAKVPGGKEGMTYVVIVPKGVEVLVVEDLSEVPQEVQNFAPFRLPTDLNHLHWVSKRLGDFIISRLGDVVLLTTPSGTAASRGYENIELCGDGFKATCRDGRIVLLKKHSTYECWWEEYPILAN